jgi:hypothetical protein
MAEDLGQRVVGIIDNFDRVLSDIETTERRQRLQHIFAKCELFRDAASCARLLSEPRSQRHGEVGGLQIVCARRLDVALAQVACDRGANDNSLSIPPRVAEMKIVLATSGHRPQSSSASRRTASLAGFFDLSQSGERPER